MKAVITGDIVHSRKVPAPEWLTGLKDALDQYGNNPVDWEIYRGDSFQLELAPEMALEAALVLKATIKQFKQLDVRMAIGIGEVSFTGAKVTESNGPAFRHSGECFEELKKQTLAIKTPWAEENESLNLMFSLATLTMDSWTPTSSEIILHVLQQPNLSQKELAEQLNKKSQGTISEGLKRGGFDEIQKLLYYYRDKINRLC